MLLAFFNQIMITSIVDILYAFALY